jgi:hypothetical protein
MLVILFDCLHLLFLFELLVQLLFVFVGDVLVESSFFIGFSYEAKLIRRS